MTLVSNRYDTSSNLEGQYQPGSGGTVLANKLHITDHADLDAVELELFDELTLQLLDEIDVDQRISSADLCEWHRRWLGNVFDWAGKYRSVNVSKSGFTFAAAHLIPGLMKGFEEKYLSRYTPCDEMSDEQLLDALSAVHIEFILIHPFREGNGRMGRLLATIMALQAGKPPMDFTYLAEHMDVYIKAIHAGLDDAEPMKQVFRRVLQQTVLLTESD